MKIVLVLFVLVLTPLVLGRPQNQVIFNQNTILEADRESGNLSVAERVKGWLSNYSEYLRSLIRKPSDSYEFDDPTSVLKYVISRAPLFALVQPSEDYYYFTIPTSTGSISGNLRLVDIARGKLSLGYFDRKDASKFNSLNLSSSDGIATTMISSRLALVSFSGTHILFSLSSDSLDNEPKLAPDLRKQFVARVRDESGIKFLMMFNPERKFFYYLADPESNKYEEYKAITDDVIVGGKSKFIFYRVRNGQYLLLTGVLEQNVKLNTFFDGPFDQVPPHIPLRDMLYSSYPYLKLSGTDPYGNFCIAKGVRSAITSYYNYSETDQMVSIVERCLKETISEANLWECLAYDEKRDFHRQSRAFTSDGTLLSGESATCPEI